MTIAIYAGSFDPVTNGHMDVLKGTLRLADQVIVAIGVHPGKKPLFSFEERVELINASAKALLGADAKRVSVISFDALVIDAARK
ncbi:MAG: adenylyltransferase/cytidyltransferase family protein, partial [Brucella pseudogrignonensis]